MSEFMSPLTFTSQYPKSNLQHVSIARFCCLVTQMSPYVCRLVGRLVDHVSPNFFKGQEGSVPCSYRSTCVIPLSLQLLCHNWEVRNWHVSNREVKLPELSGNYVSRLIDQPTNNGPTIRRTWGLIRKLHFHLFSPSCFIWFGTMHEFKP